VDVAPDGTRFLAGGNNKVLHVYDIATGKELAQLQGHHDKCYGVFSPDSTEVLSYGPDKTLRLWDVASGNLLHTLEGHTEACMGIFSRDGKHILSYSADKTVRLWDTATGQALRLFPGATDEVTGAAFVAGGTRIIAWGKDGMVWLWETGSGKRVQQFALGERTGAPLLPLLTPDGRRLIAGGAGDTIVVRDLATGREIHRFDKARGRHAFAISPDGRYLATGSFRAGVYLWRLPR
jgi:WD40 repeat protein